MLKRILDLFFWEVFDEKIPNPDVLTKAIKRRSLTLNHKERALWEKAVSGHFLRFFVFSVASIGAGLYFAFCLANGYFSLLLGDPILLWGLRLILSGLLCVAAFGLSRKELLDLSRAAGLRIERYDDNQKDDGIKPA